MYVFNYNLDVDFNVFIFMFPKMQFSKHEAIYEGSGWVCELALQKCFIPLRHDLKHSVVVYMTLCVSLVIHCYISGALVP